MKHFISHRGNINGRVPENENHPDYIDEAIHAGYEVEIDVWYWDSKLWLGHDHPEHKISIQWLLERHGKLWIHCKNHQAMSYFVQLSIKYLNWFWHQEDDMVLTSQRFIWAYPGKQPIKNSVAVMPEIHSDDVSSCIGVCSDVIEKYKHEY